jgi:hypothetical protein
MPLKKVRTQRGSYEIPIKKFIPGLHLSRMFFQQSVGTILRDNLPYLKYAAGALGRGSDVHGFDNPQSMDHNWGPRLTIVLPDEKFEENKERVDMILCHKLPVEFMGFPTNFTPEAEGYLKREMKPIKEGPVDHDFKIFSIRSFFVYHLAYDKEDFNPYKKFTAKDWLVFPEQCLLEASGGEVFHDDIGFKEQQQKFAYYPEDVWLYLMGVQWGRIGDEMSFHGRSAEMGDVVGSRILAANMVRLIMKLCFYMEKRYSPYRKWFGTAFSRLQCAADFIPFFQKILGSKTWERRQERLAECFILLEKMHNNLHITRPIRAKIHDFHGRGYKTMDVEPFFIEIGKQIKDKSLTDLKYKIGSVDQFIEHTRIHQLDAAHLELDCIIK